MKFDRFVFVIFAIFPNRSASVRVVLGVNFIPFKQKASFYIAVPLFHLLWGYSHTLGQ